MFRKTLLAAALLSLPAFADFSGGYVGVFAGTQDGEDVFHSDETDPIQILEPSGTAYGFMLGYNHQDGNFVIGTEFEIGLGTADDFIDEADANNNFGYDMRSELETTYRLRARFGYVLADSWMPFLAAGVSGANTTVMAGCATCTPLEDPIETNRIGFSVGVGLEWQMNDTWSFRGEFFTEDFGNAVYNSYDVVGDTWDMNLSMDTLRLGASMKF
jgi:opacity protein-like surface antigen